MVTIMASYNVVPNQPTPNDPLWLSDSDQSGFLEHVTGIYIYKAKNHYNPIEKMKNSLSKILVHYYPVVGRLRLTKGDRMEVDCNAKGVTFLEAESTKTFGDYGDFSPSDSTEELVPKVDYTQPIEEIPLLLLQLTRFHGGEGFALGIVISHPLTDATGVMLLIKHWAKVARGEELQPDEIPFLDRSVLKLSHQHSSPSVKLPEWKPMPQTPQTEQKKRSASMLKLTSSQVERLKEKANEKPSKEGVKPYSRFEVVGAHIWRCAAKARESGENHPTFVRFSVNIRSRLNPPLPQNFFGNALVKVVTPKCYEGDIISKPLGFSAEKIREAAHAVTDEFIGSQLKASLGQEQHDNIRSFFKGQGHFKNNPYAGNHNIFITSLTTMPVYEGDFGWGKPMHYGVARVEPEDKAAIIGSPNGDGFVVLLFFPTALIHLFKKYFYEEFFVSLL